MMEGIIPTSNDVLFATDTCYDNHLGNQRFKRIVANRKAEYNESSPTEKAQVAYEIIKNWRCQDPPGRFLSFDQNSGCWHDIGNKKAREKTSKYLRQKNTDFEISQIQISSPNVTNTVENHQFITQNESSHTISEIDEESAPEVTNVKLNEDPKNNGKEHSFCSGGKTGCVAIVINKLQEMSKGENKLTFVNEGYPEKLFERETQIELLENTLSHAKNKQSHVVLIRGSSGTGKTTLARFLQRNCYCNFVHGNFINGQQYSSHSAFGMAFSSFMRDLDRNEKLSITAGIEQMTKSSAFIRSQLACILEIIPEFRSVVNETIMSWLDFQNREAPESHSSSVPYEKPLCSRYKYLLGSLLMLLSSSQSGKPLVLFMDDAQWASESDIDVLFSVASEIRAPGIMFVLTLTDEGSLGSVLLEGLASVGEKSVEITLTELNETQLQNFLSQLLLCSHDDSRSLASIMWPLSKGNFVIVQEYLRLFIQDEMIQYLDGRWCWDVKEIQDDVEKHSKENFLSNQITQLPDEIQENLRTASCIGTVIVSKVIELVMTGSSIESSFGSALQRRWIVMNTTHQTLSFSHDLIRKSVYESISEESRSLCHYRLGKKLWRRFDMKDLVSFIFVVVDQLVLGRDHVQDPKERVAVAKLCLTAGEQSLRTSGFQVSRRYFLNGINFLDAHTWREDYNLCLNLYNLAAECSYSSGRIDDVEKLFKKIIKNARNIDDTARVRIIYLTAIMNIDKLSGAEVTWVKFLKLFGERFPLRYTNLHIAVELARLQWRMRNMTDAHILTLPQMKDFRVLTVMQMFNVSILRAAFTTPKSVALIGFRMMKLSLDYGISSLSSTGFVIYGYILCSCGLIDEGFRFAQLGYSIQEMFGNINLIARFHGLYHDVAHWKKPFHESCMPLLAAYRIGSETGDIEYSLFCGLKAYIAVLDREPLREINAGLQLLSDRMVRLNQHAVLLMTQPTRQFIHNLLGLASGHPSKLNGQIFDESQLEKVLSLSHLVYLICYLPILSVRYMFGYQQPSEPELLRAVRAINIREYPPAFCAWTFLFDGLICISQAREKNMNRSPRAKAMSKALRIWANYEPHNFLGKHFILEAELQSLIDKDSNTAFPKYVAAIAMAKQTGSLVENALSHELTAKYFLRLDRINMSEPYGKEAIRLYNQWGATAKSRHLLDEVKHVWNV